MKSYGLDVVGFLSGLDVEFIVGFVVGYRVLEKQKQTCIESNPHASRRDARHRITKRQKTKNKNLASSAALCEETKCIIGKLTGCRSGSHSDSRSDLMLNTMLDVGF